MTLNELADALEKVDEEAFASMLLEYELNHDDEPKVVKTDRRGATFCGRARISCSPAVTR
ncbi:hypothetical protein ACVIHH_007355 [Bradyrhizobium sp. USDA 4518]